MKDFYHTDHLGSTRLVTDESGNTVTDTTYEPFGGDETAGIESYLFTGKEKDSTELYYFGARYYDSQTGRFLTRDPLPGNLYSPQTLNQYTYCLNNPYRYTDPQGMETDDMHCQYVILPDGTISYELAEIYNKLRAALEKLSEEEWAEIEGCLSSDDPRTKLTAVKKILAAAGIGFNDCTDYLTITLGKMTFTIDFANLGRNASGIIMGRTSLDKYNPNLGFIELSNKISSAGDFFLILGHELIHASMYTYHGATLESIRQRFGQQDQDAYIELISYQWEFGIMNQVPRVSSQTGRSIKRLYTETSILWYSLRCPFGGTIM